ncbi:MAG: hypothetical protein KDI80_15040, partial [Xanthomonadales bacterium]|nr:hypothetical protein [Xanthomonadales bacterium]
MIGLLVDLPWIDTQRRKMQRSPSAGEGHRAATSSLFLLPPAGKVLAIAASPSSSFSRWREMVPKEDEGGLLTPSLVTISLRPTTLTSLSAASPASGRGIPHCNLAASPLHFSRETTTSSPTPR